MSKYKIFIPNDGGRDKERAVLPTLIYAHDKNSHKKVSVLALGWWKWGIALKKVTEL